MTKKKDKFRERSMTIKLPAWEYDVHVILSDDVSASHDRIIKKLGGNARGAGADGWCIGNRDACECWLVFGFDPSNSTVAHECWHAIHRMFRYAGAELENEAVAYHLGYLVRRVTRLLIKCAREKKK